MEIPFLIKVFCIMAMMHDLLKLIFYKLSYELLYHTEAKKEIVTEALSNFQIIMKLFEFTYIIFLVYIICWASSYAASLGVIIIGFSFCGALISMRFYKHRNFMIVWDIIDSVWSLFLLTLIAINIF